MYRSQENVFGPTLIMYPPPAISSSVGKSAGHDETANTKNKKLI